jgi:uncharacterized repeat protein (TIGR03803 family)
MRATHVNYRNAGDNDTAFATPPIGESIGGTAFVPPGALAWCSAARQRKFRTDSGGMLMRYMLLGALVALAGCGGGVNSTPQFAVQNGNAPLNPASAERAAQRARSSPAYNVIYNFRPHVSGRVDDGRHPGAGLFDANGTLYGTTFWGGVRKRYLDGIHPDGNYPGFGTVYAITTAGSESVVYAFKGVQSSVSDGAYPDAPVVDVHGTLFGTTYGGGANRAGTVFSIASSGAETLLHSFAGKPSDGSNPTAGLVNVNGTLYGATTAGGKNDDGTIFSITPSGTEMVLHSFAGKPKDGSHPSSALHDVRGTLYGTTESGGASDMGTVFSIAPSGTETVLYSFKGGTGDGADPRAGLIDVKGTLYGTTLGGGLRGRGTAFSIAPSGKETVLYNFRGLKNDGTYPVSTLVNVKGMLYGTLSGGTSHRHGAVFSLTLSGAEKVLHSFTGGPGDGADPAGGVVNVSGTLYGTTYNGGETFYGTVYALTP